MVDKKTNKEIIADMHISNILESIKQLDIMIGTEKVLIKHATMGEYQHSQQIEALEVAKKALEMQMPKKVIKDQNDVSHAYNYYSPNCKNDLDCYICLIIDADRESDVRYCGHCGQALDWGDT